MSVHAIHVSFSYLEFIDCLKGICVTIFEVFEILFHEVIQYVIIFAEEMPKLLGACYILYQRRTSTVYYS